MVKVSRGLGLRQRCGSGLRGNCGSGSGSAEKPIFLWQWPWFEGKLWQGLWHYKHYDDLKIEYLTAAPFPARKLAAGDDEIRRSRGAEGEDKEKDISQLIH
jgi:hypothetical protein